MTRGSSSPGCIHHLFEVHAERAPNAIALVLGDEQLGYGELDRRANQLAYHLRSLGVGPDTLVGLCLDRSFELVVGALGILKAGGAYLPLDPAYPPERLAFMLADAAVPIVLTSSALRASLPPKVDVIALDTDWPAIAREPATAPRVAVTPDDLAYVSYTSGSTGLPKGAEIPHRSVPGYMLGVDYARFDAQQTFLQYSSISWDAFTLELWTPLLHGARCVLYPGQGFAARELAQTIAEHHVTTLWASASVFNTLLDSAPDALASLRQVLVGGEALSVPHIRRALDLLPHTRLVNGYGPAECTVFACCYPIPPDLPAGARSVPIGRPIGDRRVYLLDRRFALVPVGVPGELCIGGPGVGRGYLSRPALTAERFAPDPFAPEPGARLYRTGDLARYRPDGTIEFLGRLDQQVKVRGFRVEPGEVEAALRAHPAVRAAAVVAHEDSPGERRLVAYVVPQGGAGPSASELRGFLRGRLPAHMVPAQFVALDALPKTSTGKLDRQALAAPDRDRPELDSAFAAPSTPIEQAVAELWAELLKVERVGVHDSFFDLGGHSLLATQVISRTRDAFGVEVPLRSLLQAPTVASFAAALVASEARPGQVEKVASILNRIGSMSAADVHAAVEQARRVKA